MTLCNTSSKSAGDVKPGEPVEHDVIKTGSRSAGAYIPVEPDQHDFYITMDPNHQMINQKNRINMML